jgi:hypothetical protein
MPMKRIALFLREEQIREAKKHGEEHHVSLAWVVRTALDHYLDAWKNGRSKRKAK